MSGPAPLRLRGGRLLTASGWTDADLDLADGGIAAVGSQDRDTAARVFDVGGSLVVPGFVDVHVHGAAGAMCEDAAPDGLRRISSSLASFGVTGFLATIAALPPERLRAAVANVAAVAGSEPGARILGIHLEGPYLNPLRAGAQPRAALRSPSLAELDELQDLAGGRIRWITLAPELDGALDFIVGARRRGLVVALGHTDATTAQFEAAVDAGAQHVTHLFNAMRPLHHREAGPIGVALADDRLSVELICDGHHLDPQVIAVTLRSKRRGAVALVSDAVAALGAADGPFEMFGVGCIVADGSVRLAAGGQLAGSCLSLDRAVRNLRAWFPDEPVERWFAAASSVPAGILGEASIGAIEVGRSADLVVLDRDLHPLLTIVQGVIVSQSKMSSDSNESPRRACELCELARTTHWYAEFDQPFRFAILDCDSCDVPMVVLGEHRAVPTAAEKEIMQAKLGEVGDRLFEHGWFFDDHMRQIPDHYHCHVRPFPKGFKMP